MRLAYAMPLFAEIGGVFHRFTLSSPFIEDENQRDIKVRIAGRTIQWSTLDNVDVSPLGALPPSFFVTR
jgi:hypothetical protein